MRASDLVAETYSALDANRARSALTILGIVIGIGAVIAMTTLIGGINEALVGELGMSQARRVNIELFMETPVTDEDVQKMAGDLPDYEYLTYTDWGSAEVSTGEKQAEGAFTGVMPVYFEATATKFSQGRPFTDTESGAQVVIIDENSVRVLFGSPTAEVVGETVKIGNDTYTIVGVTTTSDYGYGDSVSGCIPFDTMAARISGSRNVSSVVGFVREGADIDAVVEKTKNYITTIYNLSADEADESFYVFSMKEIIDQANSMMASFSVLMTSVSGISLLVGGIGIMNMMLTNVTERIREIGLRKALGARRSDITRQFMLEAVTLCLAGGFLGLVLGFGGAYALAGLAGQAFMGDGVTLKPVIDIGTVVLATTICTVIGLVFGWYPARRAARLDPVESLHYQ